MDETKDVVETTVTETEVDKEAEVKEETPTAEIPEELAGLPEDIAREAMQEAGMVQTEDNSEDDESETPAEISPDSETKTEPDENILPNQKIPYVRFKQQVDKNRALESELEQLKAQLNAKQETSVPQENIQMQPQQVSQPQTPVINAEVTAKIEQAIRQEAMRMSGLDEETINSMEYMDDNDSRRQIWNTAQAMARSEIFRRIEAERQRQLDESRRKIAVHNKNVLAYNQFAQEQMSDPDFENIKNYATNEYFNKFKDDNLYQEAVAGAYARIERNMGSPQDIAVIRRFFTDAKNEYKKSHGTGGKTNNIEKKVRQGQAFPRSGDISGAGNDGGNVTVETLSRMLETTPFEQIPEEYQRKLLGYE